jgi:peroxiredoxin
MKNHIAVCGIALLALLASCKDEKTFEINGTVKNAGTVKSVYLLQADSTQISVVDSVKLSDDGTFKFKHFSPYSNLYGLRIGSDIFNFIAKNGQDIKFSTDKTDTAHRYDISGSPESEKMQEFNAVNNKYEKITEKLSTDYEGKTAELGRESDSLIKIYKPKFEENRRAQAAAIEKFVSDNKTSLAAFYAATTLDQITYEEQLVKYADEIKDKFKDNPTVQHFLHQVDLIRPLSVGHKAPDFTSTGLDGKPVKLSDYKGKYVMIDFWASWCAPCRAENPNVVKQYAIYKNKGLNILGISLDVDKKPWEEAIKSDKLTWNHASDLKRFDGPTELAYHIMAIPSNFIIDPSGIIVAKNQTGGDLEDFLKRTFNKAQ